MIKILFIGDIFGDPGIEAVKFGLNRLREESKRYDFIIANVENVNKGYGISPREFEILDELNIGCMTSGNHIWDRFESVKTLEENDIILRPANYPPGNPGFGWQIFNLNADTQIAVINLQGRVYMNEIDCPFRKAEEIFEEMGDKCRIKIVDFHAEATSEKQALGWFLDGRVSAVLGTHTHVQTADERILPGGTGYLTDVGMTGSYDSVIGVKVEGALYRFLKGRPSKFQVAETNLKFSAVELVLDETTGKAQEVNRIFLDCNDKPNR